MFRNYVVYALIVSSLFFPRGDHASGTESTNVSATVHAEEAAPLINETADCEMYIQTDPEYIAVIDITEVAVKSEAIENVLPQKEIPVIEEDRFPKPLTESEFEKLIAEAEKYLGYKYVSGGKKPSTSFDCSGYASWVLNHAGIGFDFGSRGVKNLYSICEKVEEPMPGDLVFFTRTFATRGVSHVGIYVGDGKMIHCAAGGVAYDSLTKGYWLEHLYEYGRIAR